MMNMPEVKMGIVAVSRDCFPMTLSESRRKAVAAAYEKKYGEIYECQVVVESEIHMQQALADLKLPAVQHLLYILEILDRRRQKHFLHDILKALLCLWRLPKNAAIILKAAEAMLFAVC